MRLFVPLLLTLAACGGADKSDSGDSAAGAGTPAALHGLPEGASTWSGDMQVGAFGFTLDVELDNTGGDLVASATFSDDPDAPAGFGTATYTLTGTHHPGSGALALAPDDWTAPPVVESELMGFIGTYDAAAGTIEGTVVGYASATENETSAGEMVLALVSGDGPPTALGDGAKGLGAGEHAFAGDFTCTSSARDVEGTLTHTGDGGIAGSMTVGDPGTDSPLGTFPFTGVHNPTTGGLTLMPGPWDAPAPSTLNFMIDGTVTADGTFDGDQRTNVAACPPGQWTTQF